MKYISTIEQLNELVATGARVPVLLGGDLVFLSHDREDHYNEALADRYVPQPPRTASRKNLLDKSKRYLYVSVSRDAIAMLTDYSGEAMLAADQYLAYGLQQSASRDVIILGGGESAYGGFTIEGLVFTDKQLDMVFERKVSKEHNLDLYLEDIVNKYPNHAMLWCDPLPEPPQTDLTARRQFEYAGRGPLASLVKRKMFAKRKGESESWGIIPAAAVMVAGFAIFAGSAAYQWSRLEAEKHEFRVAVSGYEEQYANSAHSLDLLRHRDYVLTEEPEGSNRVKLLNHLVSHAASVKNAIVEGVSVYRPGDMLNEHRPEGADAFMVELSVPQTGTARFQARPIVNHLSAVTGMSVQVIEHRDVQIDDEKYWQYKIGGGHAN